MDDDCLDTAKTILKDHLENETTRKYFKNVVMDNDLLKWLIEEVENLRSQIESLTKERSQLLFDRQELRCLRDDLKAEVKRLERVYVEAHAELIPLIQKNTALTKEVAELKKDRRIQNEAIADNHDEIRHLKAKLAESADKETKDGLLMIISGLQKQLAESEKKVEELEDLIDSYKGEGIYGA